MFKTLLKKQLFELNTVYFYSKKNGKRRSSAGVAGMIILFTVIFLSVAFMMFAVSFLMASVLLEPDSYNNWLYYAMMGMLAIIFGTFGSVFNTYESLYKAKDNEMLLSMPIPTWMILSSRMFGVVLMSLLYTSLVWIPAFLAAWTKVPVSPLMLIMHILYTVVISALVTVLTCVLGWVVALCSTKMKNKSITIVIISLIFFAGYYYVCFNLNSLLEKLADNAQRFGEVFESKLIFIYLLGQGCNGDVLSALLFIGIVAAFFALACFVLSKTFVSIISAKSNIKSKNYKATKQKKSSVKNALVRREFKHFISSSTYMLNAGLGLVFLPAVAIIAVFKADTLIAYIDEIAVSMGFTRIYDIVPVAIVVMIDMFLAMNAISASSISLEGKNIWIAQTIPVDTMKLLDAKEALHIRLNSVPAVFSAIVLGVVFSGDLSVILIMVASVLLFTWVTADLGLVLNLNLPNLNWTNEAVPVKQSICVFIMLFGGWFICLIMFFVYMPLMLFISAFTYILGLGVVEALAIAGMRYWLKVSGTKKFECL